MGSQHVGEELAERPYRPGHQSAFWGRPVQVLGDGDQTHPVLTEDTHRLQQHFQVPCPAVQGVNDNYVKYSLTSVLQQLAEHRPLGNGIGMGGPAFFPVSLTGSPAPL